MAVNQYLAEKVDLPKELLGSGFPILEVLLHKGPLTQCEIGRKILRTTGNISQALDKLETAQLIRRQPGPDRRSHTVELTDRGRELISTYFPRMAQAINESFSSLTEEELMELSRLCRKLGLSLKSG